MQNNTSTKNKTNRVKLGGQLTAQLESGTKLTVTHSCPPTCKGMDQHIVLFDSGLEKLQNEWRKMEECLAHNQHYTVLLELNFDPESNIMDYVTATVAPEQNLLLFHIRADLLSTDYYNPKYFTHAVTLNQKSFGKLGEFITKYSKISKQTEKISQPTADETESAVFHLEANLE